MKVLLGGGDLLADSIAEYLLQLEWAQLVGLVAADGPAVERARRAGVGVHAPSKAVPTGADIYVAAELPQPWHPRWSKTTPAFGGLHVHLSLLPEHRGVDPVRWALLEGEAHCGATIHYVTEAAYEGNILAQEREEIKEVHDAASLDLLLRGTARDMLVKVLHALAKIGPLPGTPQKTKNASEHRSPPDRKLATLDFGQPMAEVLRRIQAFCHPHGGAVARYKGQPLTVWKALPVPKKAPPGNEELVTAKDFKGKRDAGSVLAGPEERRAVRCGCGGVLEILEAQSGSGSHDPRPTAEVLVAGDKIG